MDQLIAEFDVAIQKGDHNSASDLVSRIKTVLGDTLLKIPFDGSINEATYTARNLLEMLCQLAANFGEGATFERYYSQLKTFYFDYKGIQPSERQSFIFSLWLLYLLSSGRTRDGSFYLELERYTNPLDNTYTKFVVDLERDVSEGRYNQVWNACANAPNPLYKSFLRDLISTTRNDLFNCIKESYISLSVPEAMKLLLFLPSEEQAFHALLSQRNGEWTQNGNTIYFQSEHKETSTGLSSTLLINESLKYAHEMERII